MTAIATPTVTEICLAAREASRRLAVMGSGEKNSSCPKLQRPDLTVRQIGDGHHFSGLAPEIAAAVMSVGAARTENGAPN